MGFLKKLLLWVVVIVLILVGIGFVLPEKVHVERSIVIARPASEVYAVINSYRRFNEWSPWYALDPTAKYTVSGPVSGVGAKQTWESKNDNVGSGNQEIVATEPNKMVKTQLDFGDMGRPVAVFTIEPIEKDVKLTWSLDADMGKSPVRRYFGLFMDSMVGKDYEIGLAKLKTLVESFPNADITGVSGEEQILAAQNILYVSGSSSTDPEAIAAALGTAYSAIGEVIKANGLNQTGAPLAITTSYDNSGWKFDAAIPVDRSDNLSTTDVRAGSTYSGKALVFTHVGAYDKLGDTIMKAYAWTAVQGYKTKDRLIEEFVSDPGNTPAEQVVTRIKIPVE